MSVYGGFDDRFRQRPPMGRLALVTFCQFVIAVWLANALVSTADMAVWRTAKIERAWIVYLPPWTTLKSEASRRIVPVAQREYERFTPYVTGGFALAGLLLLFFWPGRQSLAGRLFSVRLAQCIAIFGAGFALRHKADLSPPVLGAIAVAAGVVIAGEWQTNNFLAQTIDLRRATTRLGQWLLRAVPGSLAIGAAAYLANERIVLYMAFVFAVLMFIANLIRGPVARYERLDKITLGTATVASLLIAAAIVVGSEWLFGFAPLRAPHVVVVTPHAAHMETWDRLANEIPGMFPAFDIHWTTPTEKKRVRTIP